MPDDASLIQRIERVLLDWERPSLARASPADREARMALRASLQALREYAGQQQCLQKTIVAQEQKIAHLMRKIDRHRACKSVTTPTKNARGQHP